MRHAARVLALCLSTATSVAAGKKTLSLALLVRFRP